MLLVDTCETINESMVQLIFQVSIILASNLDPTGASQPITTLQILVLVKTFIMASKGPAEDFLAAKMRRLKNNQGSKEEKEATTEEPGTKDKTLAKKSDKGCERKQTKGKNEETPSDKEQDDQDGKAVRHEPDPNKTFNQCHCIKTEVEYYHEMGIGKKLRMIGKLGGMILLNFLYITMSHLWKYDNISYFSCGVALLHQLDCVQGSLNRFCHHIFWIRIPPHLRGPRPCNCDHRIHEDVKGRGLRCERLQISYNNR